MNDFKNIKEIVEQLDYCNYTSQGGPLNMNVAFIRLKEISELNYQPCFGINENVFYEGKPYFVFAIRVAPTSHPDPELEYLLSIKNLRQSTTNEAATTWVREHLIKSLKEHRESEIAKAKEILSKYSQPI